MYKRNKQIANSFISRFLDKLRGLPLQIKKKKFSLCWVYIVSYSFLFEGSGVTRNQVAIQNINDFI